MKKEQPESAPKADAKKYPMRINQYLALNKHSTRKGGDELVQKGKVFINGRRAVLGDKVTETDIVELRSYKPKQHSYYAYNKPRGVLTHSAGEGEEDIEGKLAQELGIADVFPVGRLDKDSYGLIILTDDGRLTDRLLNPEYAHDKEYIVTTREPLRESFKEKMEAGVDIEGYMTKPCVVKILSDNTFSITLSEGKKHQIRRMVSALRNEVTDLKRVRILTIKLGDLRPGQILPIEGPALGEFLSKLGL